MEGEATVVSFGSGRVRHSAMKFSIVAIAAFAAAAQSGAQTSSIDTSTAQLYFRQLRQLGADDGGRLWGKMVTGPMLFVDPASRSVVANEPDTQGLLHQQGTAWVGMLPKEMSPANTAVDLGGKRWSMVMWPVSDSRYARQRLLMHESFHRIQKDLGIPMSDPSNAHLATVDGRIWTRLEWRALTEALIRSGQARRQALTDALVFRARRRSLAPSAAEDERRLELNEGLAEYTGFVLSGLPRTVLADRVAVQLAQSEQQESFVRSFAYASGPAYGLLLDATGIPWRARLNASSDISAMAARAYGVSSVDPRSAETRIDRYDGTRMIGDERARDARRAENEIRLRARFIDGPALTLTPGHHFSFSFDPNGAIPIPGVGTVYESSRITDDWGVADVAAGGVLFLRTGDGAITGVVLAAPSLADGSVKGDGWRLTLANGWSVAPGVRPGSLVVVRK
jgi:hypothetical protein